MKFGERFRQMKGGAPPAALHHRDLATGFNPIKFAPEIDTLDHFEPLVEVDEIRATAQEHVLAIVDGDAFFSGVYGIRGGPSAQKWTRFIHRDRITYGAQSQGG
jgi:hypothetical protein